MPVSKTTLIAALVVVTATVGMARSLSHEMVRVDAEGADRLDVSFEFAAGELRLEPGSHDEAAVFDISYDDRDYDHEINYRVSGKTGELTVKCEHDNGHDLDTDDNEWLVTFSDQYETALDMDIGACDAEMEFGGLSLEELTIDVGAASATIAFSKVNPVVMEKFAVDAGACSLTMNELGNANFRDFTLNGGASSLDLDFRGKYTGESTIDLDVGVGSADIVLPKGIPCRIETNGGNFLSSIDIHGRDVREIDDDLFESRDFDDADVRIILSLDVGIGSIDVYWK